MRDLNWTTVIEQPGFKPVIESSNGTYKKLDEITSRDQLLATCFEAGGQPKGEHASLVKHEIIEWIEAQGGHVYKSVAKSAKSVITQSYIHESRYSMHISDGKKVFSSVDVLNYVRSNPVKNPVKETKRIKIPNYDPQQQKEFRQYFKDNYDFIKQESSNNNNNSLAIMEMGQKMQKGKRLKYAAIYFYISAFLGSVYSAEVCAKIFRQVGLFEEEVKVLERGLQSCPEKNKRYFDLYYRLRDAKQLVKQIEEEI